MATTLTLAHYFEAWQRNHVRTDDELAAYLGVTADQCAALAAEPVEPAGPPSLSETDAALLMPAPPLSTDLDPIIERHAVNGQRLRNVVYGRY
jgi:hypothetical protein